MNKILNLSLAFAFVGVLAGCASSSVEESSSVEVSSSSVELSSSVEVSSSSEELSSSSVEASSSSVEPSSSSIEVSSSDVSSSSEVIGDYATELFISEYIEGSSNNKAVELYNGTGADVDLSSYSLVLFSNGALLSAPTFTQVLTGILQQGETFIVYNSDAANASLLAAIAALPADRKIGSAYPSTVISYNGNDAFALVKSTVVIDVIGVIGTNPGTAWTGTDFNSASASTLNMTLGRAAGVKSPNATFTWSEWVGFALDTSTGVGNHTM